MGKSFYDELKAEINIDRQAENKDIYEYQTTKNVEILERVFKNRVSTLKYWAKKHYFPGLAPSIEDFYGELVIVFVKAVESYKVGRGSFNTCLYTFLLNRIKNIKSGKYARKRQPENYEGTLSGIMLSMDHVYGDGEEGMTLGDKIENESSNDYHQAMCNLNFSDSLNILSDGNERLKDLLVKIGNGNSIQAVLKECKTRNGVIKVDDDTVNKLINSENNIENHIREIHHLKDFKLIDYDIVNNSLKYTIELKKTEDSDMLSKAIRKIRNNKNRYLKLIKHTEG